MVETVIGLRQSLHIVKVNKSFTRPVQIEFRTRSKQFRTARFYRLLPQNVIPWIPNYCIKGQFRSVLFLPLISCKWFPFVLNSLKHSWKLIFSFNKTVSLKLFCIRLVLNPPADNKGERHEIQ